MCVVSVERVLQFSHDRRGVLWHMTLQHAGVGVHSDEQHLCLETGLEHRHTQDGW